MSHPLRSFFRVWLFAALGSLVFLIWAWQARDRQVRQVTALAAPALTLDATSPTGYSGGQRRLLMPANRPESHEWVAQTQTMLAQGAFRLDHVDYDNAPFGRATRLASPYRWWLAALAWGESWLTAHSPGLAVETAARHADPLLHLALWLGAVLFTARFFGGAAAAGVAAMVAAGFPLATAFLPGQPDRSSLSLVCAAASLLPLVGGAFNPVRARGCFMVAALAGAAGLWVDAAAQVPLLLGLTGGALLAAGLRRRAPDASGPALPWRLWGLAGAAGTLLAYLAEFAPHRLGAWDLGHAHPVYGLAWLGAAEWIVAIEKSGLTGRRTARQWLGRAGAAAAAATPVLAALASTATNPFAATSESARLSALASGPSATSLAEWLARDGLAPAAGATLLPVLLLLPAAWWLGRRPLSAAPLRALSLAVGAAVVSLGFAAVTLRTWVIADVGLLAVLAALGGVLRQDAALPIWLRRGGVAAMSLLLAPGALLLARDAQSVSPEEVSPAEIVALVERDLSLWLAQRTGGTPALALAPPQLSQSLHFHGGLRVLGTPYPDNEDGFAAAVRLCGATSPDEARALVENRGVTHIIIPSWDAFLDEYARLGANQPENSFVSLLRQWLPPRWLRPVPYQLPQIPGFENQSAVVFEVVDIQDNATALAHLCGYFVETRRVREASAVSHLLAQSFPEELISLLAQAQAARARQDAPAFSAVLATLLPQLEAGNDDLLEWDDRIALAFLLAEGRKIDLAKAHLTRCLAATEAPRLRKLSSLSVYRLLRLSKALATPWPDPALRALAVQQLPAEFRDQL